MAIEAPASASPRAMPRPIPPLPPVTMATLPRRSNGFGVMATFLLVMTVANPAAAVPVRVDSALALPDQDQAERRQRGAIPGPLDLADHEARLRPLDHAGALADPEQPDGEREKANDQKQFAHGLCLKRLARGDRRDGCQSGARDLLAQGQGTASRSGQRSPAPIQLRQNKRIKTRKSPG